MVKAYRIQEKVKGVGFEFENEEQVWNKIKEELEEFKKASNSVEREQEFGDVLFSMINYARFIGIEPELALEKTNKKFIKRFRTMESLINSSGIGLENVSLEKFDQYWEEAKLQDRNK